MNYPQKVSRGAKILIPLACCAFLTIAAAPRLVAALSVSEIFSQPKVLGNVTSNPYPFPNASLVKDGGTIYFISGTSKIPFTNYKAFTGLGYSLRNVVKGDLSGYNASQNYLINTANIAHPWGSWLSYNKVIYYAAQDGLIGVPSADIFLSSGGKWNLVVKANKYDVAVLKANPALAVLTDNDPRVASQSVLQFGGSTPPGSTTATTSTTTVMSFVPQISIPQNVYASTTATFSAVSADPNRPLTYTFSWGDGSPSNSVTVNSAVHIYYLAGSYILGVLVSDSQQNVIVGTTTVAVSPPPNVTPSAPVISLPSKAAVGTDVTVSASAGDPQGLPLAYTFSWGDGSADTVAPASSADHSYSYSDSFIVKVTATDSQGNSNFSTAYLYVAPQ